MRIMIMSNQWQTRVTPEVSNYFTAMGKRIESEERQNMKTETISYTPGPWKVELWHIGQEKKEQLAIVAGASTDCVAYIQPLWNPIERDAEVKANAKLIASAPELLELVRAMSDQLVDANAHARDPEAGYDISDAEVLIARAEVLTAQVGLAHPQP